jgi:methyl-accepting chemotaxis protein
MKKIGPDSFDNTFKDAGELLNGVIDLNNRLNEGTEQFRTLVALSDAKATLGVVVKEFKKKLSEAKVKIILRTTDDGELKVELDVALDMIPPTLKAAYDAAIGLVDNIKKIIKETPELKEKVEKVVESVKAFSDADKVKSDLEAAGIGGFDLVKAVKNVANNVEETTRTPKILQQLLDTVQDTVKQLQEGFAELGANMEKNAADASAAAGGDKKE